MTFQILRSKSLATKSSLLCLAVIVAVSFSACASLNDAGRYEGTTSKSTAVNIDERLTTVDNSTIVENIAFRVGDVAVVQSYTDETISSSYTVDGRGDINFPLIGRKRVLGLTALELQDDLIQSYGTNYFQNPSISVRLDSKVLGKIVIDGAVGKPGVFEVTNSIVITEAIALAGGLDEDANSYDIIVLRAEEGKRKPYSVDYEAVRLGEQSDPIILPSDFIYVQKADETFGYGELLRTIPLLNFALFAATRF